jgi:apolipoprotein N-acyltransferase
MMPNVNNTLTNRIMSSDHTTSFVGVAGLLGTLTLEHINSSIAILVGLATLVWLLIKIWKEFKGNDT